MPEVHHDHGTVAHHRESHGRLELTGPLSPGTELAHEVAGRVEHQDTRPIGVQHCAETPHRPFQVARGYLAAAEAVDDVEVPARIEPDVADAAEHFPRLAVHDTDQEDLREVGVQVLVPAGEVDDFLGGEREREGQGGGDEGETDGGRDCLGGHR